MQLEEEPKIAEQGAVGVESNAAASLIIEDVQDFGRQVINLRNLRQNPSKGIQSAEVRLQKTARTHGHILG